MRYLDLTLPTAAENIALDEALLEEAEAAAVPTETLRVWESPQPLVVIGRSSQFDVEVRVDACRAAGIPILRRVSGGAAIVAGPGCLMYALVLSYQRRPDLRPLNNAHRYVLDTLAAALTPLAPGVQCRGTSDLALGEYKFSGNSVRCRRNHFLYHGTLLYDFPLWLIERWLKMPPMPPRMPDYRTGRPHGGFVTNLPLKAETIRQALVGAWAARQPCGDWPAQRTAQLVAAQYSRPGWNERGARTV
jgi:lipoate---protein ligase